MLAAIVSAGSGCACCCACDVAAPALALFVLPAVFVLLPDAGPCVIFRGGGCDDSVVTVAPVAAAAAAAADAAEPLVTDVAVMVIFAGVATTLAACNAECGTAVAVTTLAFDEDAAVLPLTLPPGTEAMVIAGAGAIVMLAGSEAFVLIIHFGVLSMGSCLICVTVVFCGVIVIVWCCCCGCCCGTDCCWVC